MTFSRLTFPLSKTKIYALHHERTCPTGFLNFCAGGGSSSIFIRSYLFPPSAKKSIHSPPSQKNVCSKTILLLGGRQSSVVSSVPSFLRPRIQILSTPFKLLKLYLMLEWEKEEKKTNIGQYFKKLFCCCNYLIIVFAAKFWLVGHVTLWNFGHINTLMLICMLRTDSVLRSQGYFSFL